MIKPLGSDGTSFDAALRVIVGVALVNAVNMAALSFRTRETRR